MPFLNRLRRTMSSAEAWGFSVVGYLMWFNLAPLMQAEIGSASLLVWIPGVIVGILFNLQVQSLGEKYPDVSGGTPNYITRLLDRYPALSRYLGIAYFLGWVSFPPINAIVITNLIQFHLEPMGLSIPEKVFEIGFTAISYFLAFSGTRAVAILHLFFIFPSIGFLLLFCVQGLGWLALDPQSPGLLPSSIDAISVHDWLKWFLFAAYSFYGCDTASSFVADSLHPKDTLKALSWVAWFMPLVFVGGTLVLVQLATAAGLEGNLYGKFLVAAKPFWGDAAPVIVTLLVATSCLLGSATSVCNTPRILFQLAQDGLLSPVFGAVSRRGALEPALLLTFICSLGFLVWGNTTRIVVVSGVSFFISIMGFHLGLWMQRNDPVVRWGRLSLALLVVEFISLVVGGVAWGWMDFGIGLLLPLAVIAIDAAILRIPWPFLHLPWWDRLHTKPVTPPKNEYFVVLQVAILIALICGTATISWLIRSWLLVEAGTNNPYLLIIVLMTLAFVGVAIACWTSLPQVAAIEELAISSTAQAKELETTLNELKKAQMQVIQSEKMSSLGQLVAGIAHEINNPVNFIHGNLTHLDEYTQNLLQMIELYQQRHPSNDPDVQAMAEEIDLEFLTEDIQKIISSIRVGTERIRGIVVSLRNFSRMDEADFKDVDIHEGIESTLLILQHRLKDKPECPGVVTIKDYGTLPKVECYPGQLNQVFMNILVNALDALDEMNTKRSYQELKDTPNQITIRTSAIDNQWVEVAIADNGIGMLDPVKQRIFDPFFTTKAIGKGTGLGMSISYQIITEKHRGKIKCFSTPGSGTKFVIQIPIRQQPISPFPIAPQS
ncbi:MULTISPECIES: ATP-binding protein [unclassified Microcoleus]|uniref:ATP-binding protein n=1 Tax=unclassified Microcoleus TaxID=2642155 RepID=UPI004040C96E